MIARASVPVSRAVIVLTVVLTVASCSRPQPGPAPIELTRDTACALDGMLLMDYPGPKAQIHYEQGPPDFFCDTVEMFSIYLRPEQRKRVLALYTQDMAKAAWEAPRDHWIDAKSAFYVLGSSRMGSMGPTLASFAREEDARAFAGQHGGQVLRFEQVTPEMVDLSGGVVSDEQM